MVAGVIRWEGQPTVAEGSSQRWQGQEGQAMVGSLRLLYIMPHLAKAHTARQGDTVERPLGNGARARLGDFVYHPGTQRTFLSEEDKEVQGGVEAERGQGGVEADKGDKEDKGR